MPGLGIGAGTTRARRWPERRPDVFITASVVPASSGLSAGQALRDTANWAVFTAPSNYSTSADGQTIASVVVNYIGAAQDAVSPLMPGDINIFSITVTDTGGGQRTFTVLPRSVQQAAPGLAGPLADLSFNEATGEQRVSVSGGFTGTGLVYAITPLAGVSIDPTSGLVTVDTTLAPVQGTNRLTVVATNPGGSVESSFDLTILSVSLEMTGLRGGVAIIGEDAMIGAALSDAFAIGSFSWGSRLGGTEFGNGPSPTPFPAADGGVLHLTVTRGGKQFRQTAPVTYAAPVATGGLADQSFTRNSGSGSLAASSDFTGNNLSFSLLAPAGVSIDTITGLISFDTAVMAEQSATSITVTAFNSGGSAQSSFGLTVSEAVLPASAVNGLTDNPTHGLIAQIGRPLTGTLSTLTGGEVVVHRWTLNDVLISGANTDSYTPVADNDLGALRYAPTVNGATIRSAAHTIRHAPPVAGALAPVTGTQGSIALQVDVASGFVGDDLSYSEDVPWASISGSLLTITDALRSDRVAITATNSGGSAEVDLIVTITPEASSVASFTANSDGTARLMSFAAATQPLFEALPDGTARRIA